MGGKKSSGGGVKQYHRPSNEWYKRELWWPTRHSADRWEQHLITKVTACGVSKGIPSIDRRECKNIMVINTYIVPDIQQHLKLSGKNNLF